MICGWRFKARIVLPSQIKAAMDTAGEVLTGFAKEKVNATIQAAIQSMLPPEAL